MRWLYADAHNPDETSYRRQTLDRIDAWWREFQKRASDLSRLFHRESQWDIAGWMENTLQAVDPRLMWEYGPAVKQAGHRLVITPEGHHFLRPMLRTLLERCPRIPGWEFYGHRLPESVPQAIAAVEARQGVNITGARVAASLAPGRKVDLWFDFPEAGAWGEEAARRAAFVAAETLMGEYALDTWIGAISLLSDAPPGSLRPLPMDRAQATVSALVQSIRDQLPAEKLHDLDTGEDWSSLRLTPEPADDYAGQDDLLVASSQSVDLFRAAHGGGLFHSACHSRFGEWFCYLKLDGADVPRDRFVEFRAQFEDPLNAALTASQAGVCIGGGSGLRYAYTDLALTDVNRAAQVMRQTLLPLNPPLRSWLLFFDSELAHEWIGVHPDAPAPPLRD